MCFTAITLFAALAIPVHIVAQDKPEHNNKHYHYQLIDMGTFGGPESYVNETIKAITASRDINHQGMVGGSDTPTPTTETSNFLVCGGLSGLLPFVNHAFKGENGVVTDLGTLPGADNCSVANGTNASGEIVGSSENGEIDPLTGFNQSRPVRWKDGQIADLGTLGGYEGTASSINNRGQVAGTATNAMADPFACFGLGTQCRAFLWQDGAMKDLGTLGGPDALAVLINERGQIAGMANTSSSPSPACGFLPLTTAPFLWQNGHRSDLGTLGGTCGFPLALNNRGQIVGASNLAGDLTAHPFLWPGKDGTMQDLGTLGGSYGTANAINDSGEVVGYASNSGDAAEFAILWRRGVLTNLGTLDGDPCSTANAINSKRQVVGISFADCNAVRRAFLWENGSMVDLNTLIPPGLGVQLNLAETINDRGEIAANGDPPGCGVVEQCGHAYLLIPCDENHPDVEGCDYSMVEASAARSRPSSTGASAGSRALSPALMLRVGQSRFAGRTFGPRD
jgi:probable HAF family extracellular repeat protein